MFRAVLLVFPLIGCTRSAPMLSQVLVNHATAECVSEAFWGDECSYCWIRHGWRSIGEHYYGVECPDGYSTIGGLTVAYDCLPFRSEFCCSEGSSGLPGDCNLLVFNELEKLCSMSICEPLPVGWTRNGPQASQGYCPHDWEWTGEGELDCEVSCSTIFSCDECINSGCVWSSFDQTCHTQCPGFGCLSKAGYLGAEVQCEEFDNFLLDNLECHSKKSCEDCISTPLHSDEESNCRWANTRPNEACVGCESCYASSCDGSCVEVHDCGASNLCASSTCADCLDQGCYWIFDQGPSCYHACPEGQQCAHNDEGLLCSAEACQASEDAFWDLEYCVAIRNCNSCIQRTLPSNTSKTCKWFKESTNPHREGRCSLQCPRYYEGCREVLECEPDPWRPAATYQSCTDCLGGGFNWFEEENMDRWADQCGEECSANASICLSPHDIPENVSLFEYCLSNGYGHPWNYCNVSYQYQEKRIFQPCEHCLSNGCGWDLGTCQDNCTTNGSDACSTVAALSRYNSPGLEDRISLFCDQQNETKTAVDCKVTSTLPGQAFLVASRTFTADHMGSSSSTTAQRSKAAFPFLGTTGAVLVCFLLIH